MSEEIKFTQEELDSIASIQSGYQTKIAQFGQLKLERMILEQKFDELVELEEKIQKEFTDLQKSEKELVLALNQKYGAGTLNPQTGIFTPTTQQ